MMRYICSRILQMIPVLIGVLTLAFFISNIIPGDPVLLMLGVQYTPEEYNNMKIFLGMDKPLYVQFGNYLWNALKGDFGKSIRSRETVTEMILYRFPATFILAIAAMGIAIFFAVPAGIIAAVKQHSQIDYLSMVGSLVGVSIPTFWQGVMLMLVFSLYLDWLPALGRGDPPDLAHLILPAFTLGTPFMAMTARLTRSCMLEVLRENYITAARSRGLSKKRIIVKHALRNALIPVVTNLGLQLSRVLGGAVVIEVIFHWPGIGTLAYESILFKDYPVLMGVVILIAAIFIFLNLLVDLSYTFLDPKIRYESKTSF